MHVTARARPRKETDSTAPRQVVTDFRFSFGCAPTSPFLPTLIWMTQGDGETRRFHDDLSEKIIGAFIEVHRHLGPGLLESAYEQCVCHELSLLGLLFERQRALPVAYKGVLLNCGYRLDIVVAGRLIVEIKAVERLLPIHKAQVLTYLKLTKLDTGLLVNFNVPVLKDGLRRLTRKRTCPVVSPSPRLPVSLWVRGERRPKHGHSRVAQAV